MEPLLYILIGVLVTATLAFIYFVAVAHKAILTGQGSILEEFQNTKEAISDIGGGVKDLKGTLEGAVVPDLKAVYQRIEADGFDLRNGDLKTLVNKAGIEHVAPLVEDGKVVGFGMDSGDLKVSYMLHYERDTHDLIIRTVSATISPPTQEIYSDLMGLNYSLKIGTLGLSQIGENYIVSADYAWHLPSSYVSPEALGHIFQRLFFVHQRVMDIYQVRKISFRIILLPDYINLLLNAIHETETDNKEG